MLPSVFSGLSAAAAGRHVEAAKSTVASPRHARPSPKTVAGLGSFGDEAAAVRERCRLAVTFVRDSPSWLMPNHGHRLLFPLPCTQYQVLPLLSSMRPRTANCSSLPGQYPSVCLSRTSLTQPLSSPSLFRAAFAPDG